MSDGIDPETYGLLVKWAIGITSGFVAIFTGILLYLKGDRTEIIPITEKQLKNELKINKLEIKGELKTEFYEAIHDALSEHKDDILNRIDEKLARIEEKIK